MCWPGPPQWVRQNNEGGGGHGSFNRKRVDQHRNRHRTLKALWAWRAWGRWTDKSFRMFGKLWWERLSAKNLLHGDDDHFHPDVATFFIAFYWSHVLHYFSLLVFILKFQDDLTTKLPFNLSLTDAEKDARSKVKLPYLKDG